MYKMYAQDVYNPVKDLMMGASVAMVTHSKIVVWSGDLLSWIIYCISPPSLNAWGNFESRIYFLN